jgi:hypothetical protein
MLATVVTAHFREGLPELFSPPDVADFAAPKPRVDGQKSSTLVMSARVSETYRMRAAMWVTTPHPDTTEAPGSLLAPEPAVLTGALIGYARVSTSGQLLDRQ